MTLEGRPSETRLSRQPRADLLPLEAPLTFLNRNRVLTKLVHIREFRDSSRGFSKVGELADSPDRRGDIHLLLLNT